jgi:hypothetical protein
MIDVFNIPSNTQSTFTFYATGNWQTWNKPRGAKMIEIFCLGGGAGGGHCIVNASGSTGAGGGGASGVITGIIPAFLLPDTLYILVGKGGLGGKVSNSSGASGGISYVGISGTTLNQTLICKSANVFAQGGISTGNAGSSSAVPIISLSAFANLGLFTAIGGVGGGVGGPNTGVSGASQTALNTTITSGGAGGGGKTSTIFGTGGTITSASVILTSTVNGGVIAGQNGESGYGTLQPFCGTGGAGGAGITTGIGGQGGNGWYGCGGGGGGAGSVAGSFGGNGGDGLVIITVIS